MKFSTNEVSQWSGEQVEPSGFDGFERVTLRQYCPWEPRNIDKRRTMMSGEGLVHVTDGEFEQEVLKSEIPALVDFWAPWCGPCLTIAPAVEEIARKFVGRIKVAKMNVDENRATPGNYGIMSIPTLMLFRNGDVVERIVGVVPQSRLEEVVQKALES
jgi:thioredoxin 1